MLTRTIPQRLLWLLFLLPCLATTPAAGQMPTPLDSEFFEKEARPLLAQRCYACHSGTTPKAGLALDSQAGWQRGSASGSIFTPGDPDNSLVIKAVRHTPGVTPMPPGTPLTEREIAILARWIKQGARWSSQGQRKGEKEKKRRGEKETIHNRQSSIANRQSSFWSLQPVKNPSLPAVKDKAWAKTPIDRFILARLEAKGLKPAPPANRRTLIRRATYDLLGLPPTPAETAAFLADKSPNAYEKLIDRLLASPQYGEKWGRHWLDIVHYGDTHGYDKDKRRDHAWPYRDYVIRAFNQDKPYAQFIREQIAGDVREASGQRSVVSGQEPSVISSPEHPNTRTPEHPIPNTGRPLADIHPTPSSRSVEGIIATGFLAAGPWDFVGNVELREGTVEKEKTRLIDRDDMVATVMSTFTSMTVHCARCHDHKFDPIPQQDYYRLQAVFAGIDRGDRPIYAPEHAALQERLQRQRDALTTRRAALQAKIRAITSPELTRLDTEIAAVKLKLTALPIPAAGSSPTNGYHSGISPTADTTKWVQVDLGASVPIEEIRLLPARPTDFPDTPGFGFPVRFQVAISDDPAFARLTIIADHARTDVPNPGNAPVVLPAPSTSARYVRVTATRLWPRANDYVFALAEMQVFSHAANVARGKTVTALDSIEAGRWSVAYLTDDCDSRNRLPDLANPVAVALFAQRTALEKQASALERARQTEADARTDPALRIERETIDRDLASIQTQFAALPPPTLVYGVLPHNARPIHVLARGDVEQKGERVGPGALRCVPGLQADFHLNGAAAEGRQKAGQKTEELKSAGQSEEQTDEGQGRAALAEWIASPRNTLTWRSVVNRVWHYHFGRGIVDTPNDFGRNGARPTHPELLDWLAYHFVDEGTEAIRSAKATVTKSHLPDTRHLNFSTPNIQHPVPSSCAGSLKKLHRLIMLSATYRQASDINPDGVKVDADNRLLWRMNRRRLEAEEIRDSVLAVSGKLDMTPGGPGFECFRFKDDHSPIYDFNSPEKIADPATFRRAIYQFTVRSVQNPFLESLDAPDPSILTPTRSATLTALQALALRNDPFMIQQAGFLAARLQASQVKQEPQIEQACLLLFGRKPTTAERKAMLAYARQYGMANACRVLFNTNEFVFID